MSLFDELKERMYNENIKIHFDAFCFQEEDRFIIVTDRNYNVREGDVLLNGKIGRLVAVRKLEETSKIKLFHHFIAKKAGDLSVSSR